MQAFDSLKGKTVVITGASSGIGRAAAEAFALQGARIVLAARGESALNETLQLMRDLGASAISVPTDLTQRDQIENLIQKALQFNARIDIWINNAGVMATGHLEDMPSEALDQIIKTNLLSALHSAKALLPIFKAQNEGVLITNISVSGHMPIPYATAYSASKFGLRGMMEALESEVSDYPNIHLVSLYPGMQRSTGNMHSAKYSGFDMKVPPFSFDPRVLANQMVTLAKYPKRAATTDWSSLFLQSAYSLFPKTMMKSGSWVLRKLMDKDGAQTNGNLFVPSRAPHRIYGETMLPPPSKKTKKILLAGGLLSLAYAVFAFSRGK
ncbi:SDR family NAD(P)-dependent oxidoreductase [Chryseobacterium sp. A301]